MFFCSDLADRGVHEEEEDMVAYLFGCIRVALCFMSWLWWDMVGAMSSMRG
ncbi:hypothetical protein AZE42_01726 [Rhizopogon vesiculosus]|uniref:Uncharacterized protein n=1 Tax=Rhizopogon vesiculosus TaxID=180088 RepID=A0A1J8QM88_9AGAM|nr:hypothetical protein AZE42_01726 [Rhizopogon vesiculosus]